MIRSIVKSSVLPPWVLQVVGLTAFLFFCGFWAVTERVEPLLLAGAGTLYSAGLVQQAAAALQSPSTPPAPDPETETP